MIIIIIIIIIINTKGKETLASTNATNFFHFWKTFSMHKTMFSLKCTNLNINKKFTILHHPNLNNLS